MALTFYTPSGLGYAPVLRVYYVPGGGSNIRPVEGKMFPRGTGKSTIKTG